MKKFPFASISIAFLGCLIIYKLTVTIISDNRITYDYKKPKISLSQLTGISEDKVKYDRTYYIDNRLIGFNALIDHNYFISVIKIGRSTSNVKFMHTTLMPEENNNLSYFNPSGIDDLNARFINLNLYPYTANKVYYYIKGNIIGTNLTSFHEVEGLFTFFNISTNSTRKQDFVYSGPKNIQSFSFIKYDDDIYVINTIPRKNVSYKSLHSIVEKK